MARPRQFNTGQALEIAMATFWKHGYQATSLQMLLDAMEINRGCFYAAFVDKAGLLRRVLDRYQEHMQLSLIAPLANEQEPVAAIRHIFEETLLAIPDEQRELGCLLVNTINELPHLDSTLAKDAGQRLTCVEQAFSKACQRAIELDQMLAPLDADSAARLLMNSMIGLRVQARLGTGAEQLRIIVQSTLGLLFKASSFWVDDHCTVHLAKLRINMKDATLAFTAINAWRCHAQPTARP